MARDVMTIRLHLPQIRVLEVVEDCQRPVGSARWRCSRGFGTQ